MLPIIRQFQERHSIEAMVVVADAGMLSAGNLKDLHEAGLRFIVGSRATKAPADLASHFRWHGDAFTDGQVIDTITPRVATTAARGVNDEQKRAEPVWDPGVHERSWRAVWAYSGKRAARDAKTLTLQENRAKGRDRRGEGCPHPEVRDRQERLTQPGRDLAGAGRVAWSGSRGTSRTSPRR
jgi:hypothetical protein